MSSGATHIRVSAYAAPATAVIATLIASGLGLSAEHAITAGAAAGAGCFSGIPLTPDLDQLSISRSEWKIVRWLPVFGWAWLAIWDPYARLIKHRSPLSHWPGIGTAGRLAYLRGWIALWNLMAEHTFCPEQLPLFVSLPWIAGLAVSDTLHFVFDIIPWG